MIEIAYLFSVDIRQTQVKSCKVHVKFMEAFERYDKLDHGHNTESIIANGRGFKRIRGLEYPVYVVSEIQAISCGNEQKKVDKMPLVYLPKKLLNQKV